MGCSTGCGISGFGVTKAAPLLTPPPSRRLTYTDVEIMVELVKKEDTTAETSAVTSTGAPCSVKT